MRRARLLEAARQADAGDAVDWATLARELGYADQAHLTRDFTATLGVSPARYAVRLAAGRFSVNGRRGGNRSTVNSEAVAVWASQSSVTEPGEAGRGDRPVARRPRRAPGGELAAGVPLPGRRRLGGERRARRAGRGDRHPLRRRHVRTAARPRRADLARKRQPPDRVVGCCRDSTVLFLALARHKGIPARTRVGFAAYFYPGWLIDHVIAEAWDAAAGRWRLVEPELDSRWTPELNGRPVDWLDLADDQFVTGPAGLAGGPRGHSDPERHVVAPGLDVAGPARLARTSRTTSPTTWRR